MQTASNPAADRYHLGALLGRGGYSDVYLATSDRGRTAAFKVVSERFANDPEIQQLLAREAEVMAQLCHRHLPRLYARGALTNGRHYILMQDCGRETLADVIKRAGPLSEDAAAWYGVQICEALAYLHHRNLRHGDLKPSNVMVDDGHVARLVDFGFASPCDQALERDGFVHGTPHYVAPEVLLNDDAADSAADIYSLGALLYEMCTSLTVFSGENLVEVCQKHLYQVPTSPSRRTGISLSTHMDTLILRCLDKDPDRRPKLPEVSRALRTSLACTAHAA